MIMPMPIHTNSCSCCDKPMPTWGIITIVVIVCVFFFAFLPIWTVMLEDFFSMWSNFIYGVKESIKEWRKK